MFRFLVAVCLALSMALPVQAETDVELVMVEQSGCAYCIRWDNEISHIYPKTEIGTLAPLRRIDIHEPVPDDLEMARRLTFTPTFVLVVDGVEVKRLEGYPGEDFFWGMVEHMMVEADLMEPTADG